MNDPRSEQGKFYAWLLGVVSCAVVLTLAALVLRATGGLP